MSNMIMHSKLLFLILAASHVAGCQATSDSQRDDAPLMMHAPDEPEVDLTPARDALTNLLEARWAFDREGTLKYVTHDDREKPRKLAFKPFGPQLDPTRLPLQDWYSWEVGELRAIGPEEVVAEVTVVLPTLADVAAWANRLANSRTKLFSSGDNIQKRMEKMVSANSPLLPHRVVTPMMYRVVGEEGEWLVDMGWEYYAEVDRAESDGAKVDLDAIHAQFVGSERWWLDELIAEASRNAVSKEDRYVAQRVERIEGWVRARHFDIAANSYDELIEAKKVPEFIRERALQLPAIQQNWETAIASIDVELEVSFSPDDGREVVVAAENGGEHELRSLVVEVEADAVEHPGVVVEVGRVSHERTFAPGERKSWVLRAPREAIKGLQARILSFEFVDRGLQERLEGIDDVEFRRELLKFRNGGIVASSATAIGEAVDARSDDLEVCPEWPQNTVDAWITVNSEGSVESLRLRPPSPQPFESCVRRVLSDIGFLESEQTAVIQLVGPHHWSRE